jgi:hypothetical protein
MQLGAHVSLGALRNYAGSPIEAIVIVRIAMTVHCCAQDLALTVPFLP